MRVFRKGQLELATYVCRRCHRAGRRGDAARAHGAGDHRRPGLPRGPGSATLTACKAQSFAIRFSFRSSSSFGHAARPHLREERVRVALARATPARRGMQASSRMALPATAPYVDSPTGPYVRSRSLPYRTAPHRRIRAEDLRAAAKTRTALFATKATTATALRSRAPSRADRPLLSTRA